MEWLKHLRFFWEDKTNVCIPLDECFNCTVMIFQIIIFQAAHIKNYVVVIFPYLYFANQDSFQFMLLWWMNTSVNMFVSPERRSVWCANLRHPIEQTVSYTFPLSQAEHKSTRGIHTFRVTTSCISVLTESRQYMKLQNSDFGSKLVWCLLSSVWDSMIKYKVRFSYLIINPNNNSITWYHNKLREKIKFGNSHTLNVLYQQ